MSRLRCEYITDGSGRHGPTRETLSAAELKTLLEAVARRDQYAFVALFQYFAPRIKGWLVRAGLTDEASEELAQETMLSVWRNAVRFNPDLATPVTWIFTIARNLRIDLIRKEQHPAKFVLDETYRPDLLHPQPVDHSVLVAELTHRVKDALATLSPEQRTVIDAVFYEEKPQSEIEKHLGIPLGTVKSRLRLALARLRAAMTLERPQ